jgi:hypothetical protein
MESSREKKKMEAEEDRHYHDPHGKMHQDKSMMSSVKGSGGPFSQSHGKGRNMAQHGGVNIDQVISKPGYPETKESESASETFAKHVANQEKNIHTAK